MQREEEQCYNHNYYNRSLNKLNVLIIIYVCIRLMFAAAAVNVIVITLTSTSVLVSWEVEQSPLEGVQWVVYYRHLQIVETTTKNTEAEQALYVPGPYRSVEISMLQEGVQYVFEVASMAEVNGSVYIGGRVVAMRESTDRKLLLMRGGGGF